MVPYSRVLAPPCRKCHRSAPSLAALRVRDLPTAGWSLQAADAAAVLFVMTASDTLPVLDHGALPARGDVRIPVAAISSDDASLLALGAAVELVFSDGVGCDPVTPPPMPDTMSPAWLQPPPKETPVKRPYRKESLLVASTAVPEGALGSAAPAGAKRASQQAATPPPPPPLSTAPRSPGDNTRTVVLP